MTEPLFLSLNQDLDVYCLWDCRTLRMKLSVTEVVLKGTYSLKLPTENTPHLWEKKNTSFKNSEDDASLCLA